MPDYSKSIIYTIRSRDSVYVGSTIDFRTRKWKHKSNIYNENGKEYNLNIYKIIRENDGEWDMQPYSKYPCKDKLELTIEEERIRQLLKADLNSRCCWRGCATRKKYEKQWNEKNKDKISEYAKQYREKHKNEISEKGKQYYKEHKNEINKRHKQYNDQHKDEKKELNKQWYEKNKDKVLEKIKQKVTCACGCVIRKDSLVKHHKSKNHINLMEKLNQ